MSDYRASILGRWTSGEVNYGEGGRVSDPDRVEIEEWENVIEC